MFVRAFTIVFTVATLAGLASAAPTDLQVRDTCNSGSVQCCNSLQQSNNPVISEFLGLVGIPLPSSTTQVGLTCSPIGGGSGASCTQQTVCCSGNTFTGLIVIGCSPITINVNL